VIPEEQFLKDLRELLETDEEITMDTDLLEIDSWGSLSSVEFLVMIEEKYGVKAEPFTVAEAIFVEDLYRIANGK
jgi:acyl carrier protein